LTDAPYGRAQHPRRERPGASQRAHWLVPRRHQQLPFFALGSFVDELGARRRPRSARVPCSTLGPGKVLDLKAQGVEYSNYGAPYDKYPIDTRRLRRVLEVAGRRAAGRS
jgi:hypothetical protein